MATALSFEHAYFSQPGRATQKSVYDAILRLGGASSAQIATECGMPMSLARQVVTTLHTDELITRGGRQWRGSNDRLRELGVL